jgi:hypothetical protein
MHINFIEIHKNHWLLWFLFEMFATKRSSNKLQHKQINETKPIKFPKWTFRNLTQSAGAVFSLLIMNVIKTCRTISKSHQKDMLSRASMQHSQQVWIHLKNSCMLFLQQRDFEFVWKIKNHFKIKSFIKWFFSQNQNQNPFAKWFKSKSFSKSFWKMI